MSFAQLDIWTFVMVMAALLIAMLVAGALKYFVKPLKKTLIPVSVLGGVLLLIISTSVYFGSGGTYFFDLPVFGTGEKGPSGMAMLEMITYHCLGLGFIASGLRGSKKKFTKQRAGEVFDSGIVTVNGYLVQAVVGLVITMIAAWAIGTDGLISAAGILLAFGFGQGTGQALNYGKIYENEHGFVGGGNFGLTIAALGFLVACIGGVIYMGIMRKKGLIKIDTSVRRSTLADYEDENEISNVSSLDKMTVQFALVLGVYALSFAIMYGLSALLPSLKDTLFGFNFLIGVILTIPVKAILNKLYDKGIVKRRIINNYMMERISGMAFDLMIVAGVAAIQLPLLATYWGVLLLMALFGTLVTFFYVNFVCKKLFPGYRHEQFLAFYGMLTGTASTGMILLREIDGSYKTPASENLVYQSLPAIVFGFPLMFLAPWAATDNMTALITCIIVAASFVVLNLVLFRRQIFRRRFVAHAGEGQGESEGSMSADAPEQCTEQAPMSAPSDTGTPPEQKNS